MKSIIFFETNEIPWRVLDDYTSKRPDCALARMVKQSRNYETICEDEIELDPWISWPTLHRGVIDKTHRILHLGQSLDYANAHYPPLWELLHEAGVKVGVFGSLHSSSLARNVRDYAFYMPDYFAAEAFAHPEVLLPFQQFNLVMTRRSARNVDPGLPVREAVSFGATSLLNGLTPQTVAIVAQQLASERANPLRKIRRRSVQSVIGLDFFMRLLDRTKPQFASFYTNHVAASMHRYWAAHFVEDWGDKNPMSADWLAKYKDELTSAMDILDVMVARLMKYVERETQYELAMVSSLGQAKISTGETRGFTTITDVGRFMDFIGIDRADWQERHAMVPCVSLDIAPERMDEVVQKLNRLEIMGARPVQAEQEIAPLSFNIRDGKSLHLYFYFEGQEPSGEVKLGNQTAPIAETGLGFFVHEDNVACSAHHVPDGILTLYDPSKSPDGVRRRISTLDIAPALLAHFGVPRPAYMKSGEALAF